jgi:hypothetical protein
MSEPRLLERQRLLLRLLHALGTSVERLEFQNLLFLHGQEGSATAAYEFVPNRMGAFSFTADADRRKLVERGLLAHDEHDWRLTGAGEEAIAPIADAHLADFARRHRDLHGDALVAEARRRFPRLVAEPAAVATLGYQERSIESYLNRLASAGVTLLCDVRRNPLSRKFGFSKRTLATCCDGVGIRYEHLPELGIASEQRRGLETQAQYDALFAEYRRTSLPQQTDALARIATWVKGGERIALTCYEKLPEQCHRHAVAEALEATFGKGFAARHL